MSDGVLFWSVAVTSLLGCIVAPFVLSATVGPWWGLLAGLVGYLTLGALIVIGNRWRG